MDDQEKTPPQLVDDLAALRRRIAELTSTSTVDKEDALRRERDRAQQYLDIAGVMFVVLDAQGRVRLINRKGGEVLGYPSEEIEGRNWFDNFLPARIREEVHSGFLQLMAGEIEPMEYFENPVLTKEGEERIIAWHNTILRGDAGETVGTLSSGEDVTERRLAEETLRIERRQLLSIFDSIDEPIYIADPETYEVLYANRSFREVFGDVGGQLCYHVFHGLNSPCPFCTNDRIFGEDAGKPYIWEFRNQVNDRWYRCIDRAIQWPGGRMVRYEMAIDITDQKRNEERVIRQNAALNAINKVLEESLTCDTDEEVARKCLDLAQELTGSKFGFVAEINEAGRFRTIALSDPGWEACRMSREEADRLLADLEIHGVRGIVCSERRSLVVNDIVSHPAYVGIPEGHPPVHRFLGVPLHYRGDIMGMIGLANKESDYEEADKIALETLSVAFVDALTGKRADMELRKHRDHLEELVDERTRELRLTQAKLIASERLAILGQFAGGIAHEIRNPLGVIAASAYYLKRRLETDDEKVSDQLDQIKRQVESCADIIESILKLTRMETPKLAPLGLIDVLMMTVDQVDTMTGIEIDWCLPEDRLLVWADRTQLMLAFKNIVGNAGQAMQNGGTLTIGARIVTIEESPWAEIRFSDTGPGIAPENTEQIFLPLFTTKAKGIGFGLAIVKLIVERHGGIIFNESEPGDGATFVIRLPIHPDGAGV